MKLDTPVLLAIIAKTVQYCMQSPDFGRKIPLDAQNWILRGDKPDNDDIHPVDLNKIIHDLSPVILTQERLAAQRAELYLLKAEADGIESLLKEKGLQRPWAHGIFTAGFTPPKNAIHLGTFGDKHFPGYAPPDTEGHGGEISAVQLDSDGHCIFLMQGRAHPTEWVGERFAPMIVSHPLRVAKELARRSRADEGVDAVFFKTYLAGVVDGFPMQPGDAGIVISDSEATNVMHPSFGPVGLLDQYFGSHFGGKSESTSNTHFSKALAELAIANNLPLFSGIVCGAPGTPEFENAAEVASWLQTYYATIDGAPTEHAGVIFGKDGKSKLAPLFDMGISFEAAVSRQHLEDEAPFMDVSIVLASDKVDIKGSKTNHKANLEKAFEAAPKYANLLLEGASMWMFNRKEFRQVDQTDRSLRALLPSFS